MQMLDACACASIKHIWFGVWGWGLGVGGWGYGVRILRLRVWGLRNIIMIISIVQDFGVLPYLTQCINQVAFESQIPHQFVNSLF